jgi:orotate phosphoribosyltransferase
MPVSRPERGSHQGPHTCGGQDRSIGVGITRDVPHVGSDAHVKGLLDEGGRRDVFGDRRIHVDARLEAQPVLAVAGRRPTVDAGEERTWKTGPVASQQLREEVARIVREKGLLRLPEPVRLASGAMSQDFVDGKRAMADGADLAVACRAILETAAELGADYDAVGGMTLGADPFSHGLAMIAGTRWFVVRKAVKGRGTNQRIEGATVGEGSRVLLLEDVATTGGSAREAYEVVRATGAAVAAVVVLVDRGDVAGQFFSAQRVPYAAVITYRDLGIEPVRDGLVSA